jgi:hypothetical protein
MLENKISVGVVGAQLPEALEKQLRLARQHDSLPLIHTPGHIIPKGLLSGGIIYIILYIIYYFLYYILFFRV